MRTVHIHRVPAPVQEAILAFIDEYKTDPDNDGNSPSYREIAAAVGGGPADIYRRVLALQKQGRLRVNKAGKVCVPGGRYLLPDA